MNEIQKVELNLLKEFVKVCEKNNLRYFMVGGSALGCVRHKGFICICEKVYIFSKDKKRLN